MIVTRQKAIPFSWIALAVTPWGASTFTGIAMGVAFLFSLKKFVENPAAVTLILSLPGFISIILWPICSFLSDRIWTRWGRRKPFILISWAGMIVALALLPLAPNLWTLVAAYILFMVSVDIGSPLEPLKQEIVPPRQRGRATAAMQWMQNGANLVFYSLALGRFDDVRFVSGFPINGEMAIYWSAALLMITMFLLLALGIREINPHSAMLGERLSVRGFFTGILDRDLWPVYTLVFGSAMVQAGLGPLGNLLYTDQWGYTKQDFGTNVAIGGVLNLFIIGLLGLVADRLNRMKAYQTLIVLFLVLQTFYYVYVHWVLPDRRPTLVEMVLFGEALSVVGILMSLVYVPLVYDYVTRDKMGTYAAGAGILNRFTQVITLNGVGLFIWAYAVLFQPPAGEMTRAYFEKEMTRDEVRSLAAGCAWDLPWIESAAPPRLDFSAWNARGIVQDTGHAWEIRIADRNSEKLAEGLKNAPPAGATATDIEAVPETLNRRAEAFRQQTIAHLGPYLLKDGDQIRRAQVRKAVVANLALPARPAPRILENVLLALRRGDAAIIDLRPLFENGRHEIAVSTLLEPGADANAVGQSLAGKTAAALHEVKLTPATPEIRDIRIESAIILDVRVVEDPREESFSPVSRVVNWLLGRFGRPPAPERRLAAMARELRREGQGSHVSVTARKDRPDEITAIELAGHPAAPARPQDGGVPGRLRRLLGEDADFAGNADALYFRLVEVGAIHRTTIARPVLASGYVPLKYDYMAGYLWMLFLGIIGLAITMAFARREKKGLIRKLGVEEAAMG